MKKTHGLFGTAEEYNETEALRAYQEAHWRWYMTDFERLCFYLGLRREKAETSASTDFAHRVKAEWESQATPAIQEALTQGFSAFLERTKERVVKGFREGTLSINRCPLCGRIVRTPEAQQCFWCGHDWHGQSA